ncbi:MAG: protein kinase [Deltaproteobacteria bacterium]|nr:protein kinase [Deltaproteobacteria bacterium]
MDESDPLVAQCRNRMGQLISGKWRLDALIGVGGMAAVYAATHRNGSMAAIKLLHPEIASNLEVRSRFLREAYIANKVGHPGTVKVLDDDVDNETKAAYIVMELLQGESASAKAENQGGTLSIQETLQIADQALCVLEAAHEKSIIHRDIKPENIFITSEGRVKVLDFGIARLREENTQRTQTGMVMGTPSFMAPEQAMGRWSEVDARTDLFAVGATMFTLLTGLPVHEAETAGEMHVAAATRHARSLARVLDNVPFSLVRLVDRALAYDRENRFPDAASFRAELKKVYENIGLNDALNQKAELPQPALPPTVIEGKALVEKRFSAEQYCDAFDPSISTEQNIDDLAKVFTLIERALIAETQYSKEHPETKRRFEEAFRETASALMGCDGVLAWNLTAYSFHVGDRTVWEPQEPLNAIPYQLFSDGVRVMGLATGLDQDEFMKWIRLITIDPVKDLAPEDDLVTMLWDASFDHVFYQAIDSFAEGNQEQRARFERQRQEIISDAHQFEPEQVTLCWTERRKTPREAQSAEETTNRIKNFLLSLETTDVEAAARAANLDVRGRRQDVRTEQVLKIDDSVKAVLAARLEIDHSAISERFLVAASQAFIAAAKKGVSAMVSVPLRDAVDSVAEQSILSALGMVMLLREATEVRNQEQETALLRSELISQIVSADTLVALLVQAPAEKDAGFKEYATVLSEILSSCADADFQVVLDHLPEIETQAIRNIALNAVAKAARGHEREIAALILKADVDLALTLVRMLAAIASKEAKEAIAEATRSPHPLVRIEALSHIEGASSDKLRTELRALLEDRDPAVRLATLKAMQAYAIAAAGPFLVLRMQSNRFFKLPFDERKQCFETLTTLRPKRAEEVCQTLLANSGILSTKSVRETHELAAQLLGEIASTNESLYLLEDIARSSRWQSSEMLRKAAARALERISERAAEVLERANRAPSAQARSQHQGGRARENGAPASQKGPRATADQPQTPKPSSEPRKS